MSDVSPISSPLPSPRRKRRRLRQGRETPDELENETNNNQIYEDENNQELESVHDSDASFIEENEDGDGEEDDGEDLLENQESDYRRMETLDQYDTSMLDHRQYADMDMDTRLRVEEELNRRDAREGRIAEVFAEDNEMERDDAHRRRLRRDDGTKELEITEEEEIINLEHFDVPLREWIASERPRNEIKRRFVSF